MARKTPHSYTADLDQVAARLPTLIASAGAKIEAIASRMAQLKKAGLIYATEHWRKDRKTGEPMYLYLLYPSHVGEKREREYIGCDPEKVAAARAGIQRGKEFDQLNKQHKLMQSNLHEAYNTLKRAQGLLA